MTTKYSKIHESTRPILKVTLTLVILLGLSACNSADYKIADEFYESGINRVGKSYEFTVDMQSKGYVFLGKVSDDWKAVSGEMNNIGFQGLLINYLHYKKCQELGRIWEPGNLMRNDLQENYGGYFSKGHYDKTRVAFYMWHQDKRLVFTPTNMWLYLGNELFNKQKSEEITKADLMKFFQKVDSAKNWRVKMTYHGMAAPSWPPGWGQMHLFEATGISPVVTE